MVGFDETVAIWNECVTVLVCTLYRYDQLTMPIHHCVTVLAKDQKCVLPF